jgi:hypothetical protein
MPGSMDISAPPKNVFHIVFREPSMERIWKCAALDLGMIGTMILARLSYLPSGFLLREAFYSSPKLPWVLSWGILAFVFSLVIKGLRQGWTALTEHFIKHLFEGLIPATLVVILIFLYNVVYVVPNRIWREAASIQLPKNPAFIVPPSDICTQYSALCKPTPIVQAQGVPPKILVKHVNVTVNNTLGEKSSARVRIELVAKTSIKVFELQGTAYAETSVGTKQEGIENNLWSQLLAIKDKVPFEIRANDEDIVLAVEGDPLSPNAQAVLRSGLHLYFLMHVTDLKGRALLDFCAHKGTSGDTFYCRAHNGP